MPVANSDSKRLDRAHVRVFEFRQDSERQVTDWASEGVRASALLKVDVTADISSLRFEAGAALGRHPTGRQQLFAVINGEGWVSGPDGARHAIVAGQAVLWEKGESHESGSAAGMSVIVIQAEHLDPDSRSA
jgi:quercetin dioxygenase-like cupin family protein